MATYYVDNSDGRTFWQANHAYGLGDRCCVEITMGTEYKRDKVFECTTAGTSGGTPPSWDWTPGNTTNDNGVVWTCRLPNSWANAHPSLIFLLTYPEFGMANGDIIKVHDAHNEDVGSTDGSNYFSVKYGTPSNPVIIVCVDKNSSDIISSGAVVRARRTTKELVWNGDGATWINMQLVIDGNWNTRYDEGINWTFVGIGTPVTALKLNGASNYFRFDAVYTSDVVQNFRFINCDIELANAANYFSLCGGNYEWIGGSLIAPNGVTAMIHLYNYGGGRIFIEDVDLSAIGNNQILQGGDHGGAPIDVTISRCKLPATWPGIMDTDFAGTLGYHGKVKLHHCSASDRTWEFYEHSVEGDVEASSSIYRSGGASDGTPISWKMVSSANVDELGNPCSSPQITLPNSTVSSRTVTIHGILDSATNLQDDEVWMEVSYPADASSGLGTFKTTHKLAPYEAASDLATSTETWIGTGGFSNLNKFKLAATFTPGKAGPISARVCIGKASTTIYICPKMEIA